MMATVPKHESSDLSPEHIDQFETFEEEYAYLEQNCELLGEKCKWLDDSQVEATCLAYDRRGSDCRNYPGNPCKVGPLVLLTKHIQGEVLPEALMERLKALPFYEYYVQTARDYVSLLERLHQS